MNNCIRFIITLAAAALLQACNQGPDPAKVQGDVIKAQADGQKMIVDAQAKLDQYHYEGFRGSFTTFGIPYVRLGDNIDILDAVLPERNGRYKCLFALCHGITSYLTGLSGLPVLFVTPSRRLR